jgi:hypothetical protein
MTKGVIRPYVHHTYTFRDDRDFFRAVDCFSDEDCKKIKKLWFKRGVLIDDTLNYVINRLSGLEELHLAHYTNIGPCGVSLFKSHMPNTKLYIGESVF